MQTHAAVTMPLRRILKWPIECTDMLTEVALAMAEDGLLRTAMG